MNLALLAAAATGVQVGAAIVASRYVVAGVPPLTLALLRYAIGVLCLLPFVPAALRVARAQGVRWPPARDVAAMAALGIGQFGILIALLNYGLQHMGAARAALIFSLFPLLAMLLAVAVGRERFRAATALGVAVSIAGVGLSLVPRLMHEAGAAHAWSAEAAVLGSALLGAACSVAYRPYLQRYPTLPVSALAMAASVLFLAVAALVEHWPQRVLALPPGAWGPVLFIGVSSGAGYLAWLYALKHESPTRVTVFLALNPVTAALLGWALLGERVDGWGWAALACIGAGLWLATRPAPPASAPARPPRA